MAAGSARGTACLAWAYHDGDGVPKDLRQPLTLFRQAEAAGDAGAVEALKMPEFAGLAG